MLIVLGPDSGAVILHWTSLELQINGSRSGMWRTFW